jgi:hypothetical protein
MSRYQGMSTDQAGKHGGIDTSIVEGTLVRARKRKGKTKKKKLKEKIKNQEEYMSARDLSYLLSF